MDFSSAYKADKGKAIEDNYSQLNLFLRTFGQEEYAKTISKGMSLRDQITNGVTIEDIKDTPAFFTDDGVELTSLLEQGVKAENVYYTTNGKAC